MPESYCSVRQEGSSEHFVLLQGVIGVTREAVPLYESIGVFWLQVAWQALREDIDMPNQEVQTVTPAAVGAVLTSQRLLVVSPQMRVLLMGPPNGAAIVSFLWLGPALLYTTADHQVTHFRSLQSPCIAMVPDSMSSFDFPMLQVPGGEFMNGVTTAVHILNRPYIMTKKGPQGRYCFLLMLIKSLRTGLS